MLHAYLLSNEGKKQILKSLTSIKKIVWAVDPYSANKDFQLRAIRMIRGILPLEKVVIQPIYIAYIWYSEEAPAIAKIIENDFHELLQKEKIPELLPLKIIKTDLTSHRACANVFATYAKRENASLIILSSSAKTRIKQWLTGSFAKNLLKFSSIPLIVVNEHFSASRKIKGILFATNFSEDSRSAFHKLLGFAKLAQYNIILYHHLPDAHDVRKGTAYGIDLDHEELVAEEMIQKENEANKWIKYAESHGVSAKFLMDTEFQGKTFEAILEKARKTHSMVAITSEDIYLGNLTEERIVKKLILDSDVPMWVIHPDKKVNPKVISEHQFLSR